MGKRQENNTKQEEQRSGKISVCVIDEENGYQHLEAVRGIRINSSDYSLLILEDFADTLGRVEGNVTFVLADGDVCLENISGYYKHKRNEFTLMIQEDKDGWYEKL